MYPPCLPKAEQATPRLATTETTMGAAGTAAVAMEAWLVSMALATSVAWAMALGLTTTMEVAMEDAHPVYLDIRIHQF